MTDHELFEPIVKGILIVLAGTIRIPKIKLNFWTLLARWFGRAVNYETFKEVQGMRKELTDHIKSDNEENIKNCRRRILRFDDEILHKKDHSREHFGEILEDIDRYEGYCRENPDFPNNKCTTAIGNIKRVYRECHERHNFLSERET